MEQEVSTVVIDQAFGNHGEGDIVTIPGAVAEALVTSGIAHYASAEEVNGGGEEAPAPEADSAEDKPELVQNSINRLVREAKKAVVDATAQGLKAAKTLEARPQVGTVPAVPKDHRHGFKSLGEFAKCVAAAELGDHGARNKVYATNRAITKGQMNEGTAADGGALVPQEWSKELFVRAYEQNPLTAQCTRYPMTTNYLNIPAVNEASGSTGIVAYWVDEANAITDSKGVFGTVPLELQKLAVLVNVTEELLQDNQYALESFLRMWTPKKMAFKLNDAILNGGGNQANLVNGAATIAVTRNTASRITYPDIVNMWTRLYTEAAEGAAWFVNPSAFGDIMKLAFPDSSGTTPLFIPLVGFNQGALTGAPAGTLLGKPVYMLEQCKALGVRGDICLFNMSHVAAGYRDLDTASTIALYFDKYISSFRFVLRVDTASLWLQTYTRADGVKSSPFVVLTGASSSSSA